MSAPDRDELRAAQTAVRKAHHQLNLALEQLIQVLDPPKNMQGDER